MFSTLKHRFLSLLRGKKHRELKYVPSIKTETEIAIRELNVLARQESHAIELYIALASLYRVQGDIEKALQIHARLLVRNDVPHSVKARLYAELGKDYKNAGLLDRAIASYMQAKEFGYTHVTFLYDMIDVYDMLGEYEEARSIAKDMNDPLTESYYLVKQYIHNRALFPPTKQAIMKALDISPELAQGWVLLLSLHSSTECLDDFRISLVQALNYTPVSFLLFELYLTSGTFHTLSLQDQKAIVEQIAHVLKEYDNDFLLLYYLGIFYRTVGDTYNAICSFERSLSSNNDFWATQYELFSLAMPSFTQDDVCKQPARFFLDIGKNINRFVCSICTLQSNTVFSLCPHCKHIQTIAFRTTLH